MGCRELIESLRAAGDGKVRALRADAENEAGRMRAEAARRIGDIRERRAGERTAEAAKHAESILAAARAGVRRDRLRSERELADRLLARARSLLPSLRNVGYEGVFAAFAKELPGLAWGTVRVNPADLPLARTHFPGAEIVPDEGISGGMVAVAKDGSVTVTNTFEKRLERIWEDLLPEIMRDVLESLR